ncbi:MAG: type II toxin-antitoxin system HigB family toxin [Proteobacteria bacterium]|nr:type II toxin-antitoxin system HigB family toxin [Pseudomonadota bacterium]
MENKWRVGATISNCFIVYVRYIGTHKQYDNINAEEV